MSSHLMDLKKNEWCGNVRCTYYRPLVEMEFPYVLVLVPLRTVAAGALKTYCTTPAPAGS